MYGCSLSCYDLYTTKSSKNMRFSFSDFFKKIFLFASTFMVYPYFQTWAIMRKISKKIDKNKRKKVRSHTYIAIGKTMCISDQFCCSASSMLFIAASHIRKQGLYFDPCPIKVCTVQCQIDIRSNVSHRQ